MADEGELLVTPWGEWTPFTRAEVIKCEADRDFYVAWSHIVEAPTWAGTRAKAITGGCTPDRLDRADAHGSSWYLRDQYGHAQPGCWWGDHGLVAEQLGVLPRARLAAYATAYRKGRLLAAYAMLQRFEDVSRAEHRSWVKQAVHHHHDRWRTPGKHRRCRACYPGRPLAVNGHDYRRRQLARQRRRRN